MAQFVAEVISDKPGYGNATAAISNVASSFLGGGAIPIGTVEWAASADPTLPAATGFAAPLLPWSTTMPVEGEFILVFSAPSPSQTQGDSVADSFFYLGPIGIDGDKNKNAAAGFMNRTAEGPNLALPPIYRMGVKQMPPLQPMHGDTIIQDRNGSIIRMSSTQHPLEAKTAKNSSWKRPGYIPPPIGTSFTPGAAGNPIMAITIGPKGKVADASAAVGSFTGTKTFWENLAKSGGDRSSIILTSDQVVSYGAQRNGWKHTKQIFAKPTKFKTTGANKTARGAKQSFDEAAVDKTYENPHHGTGEFQPPATYPSAPTRPALSQIIMLSDRINIESRADSVLIAGYRDVKIGTKNWRMETDSTMSSVHQLMQQTIILTQHVQEVAKQLDETLAIMEKIQFPTGVGPTGPCLDPYYKEITSVRKVLDEIRADSAVRSSQFDILHKEFGKQQRSKRDQKGTF